MIIIIGVVYASAAIFAYGAAFARLYAHQGPSDVFQADGPHFMVLSALLALIPFPTALMAFKTGVRWRPFPDENIISYSGPIEEIRNWIADAETREYFIRRCYYGRTWDEDNYSVVWKVGFGSTSDAIMFKLRFL